FLSRYGWRWRVGERPLKPLVVETPRPDTLHAHHALIDGPSQLVAVRRSARLTARTFSDELELSNTSLEPQVLELTLELAGDFIDLFEVRGWAPQVRDAPTVELDDTRAELRHVASDGVEQGVSVAFSGAEPLLAAGGGGATATFSIELQPHESAVLRVDVTLHNPLDRQPVGQMDHEQWRASFAGLLESDLGRSPHRGSLLRAVDDLRALLLFTPGGPV